MDNRLLLSFIGSHGPVNSSTIVKWLKVCLQNAGVDASKFQAHSVRAATILQKLSNLVGQWKTY